MPDAVAARRHRRASRAAAAATGVALAAALGHLQHGASRPGGARRRPAPARRRDRGRRARIGIAARHALHRHPRPRRPVGAITRTTPSPAAWADMRARDRQGAATSPSATASTSASSPSRPTSSPRRRRRACRLIDEIGSPAPAHRARPGQPLRAGRPAERRAPSSPRPSTLLAGHIAMAHAKDRDADGRFATAGQGVVDFADFIARLRARRLRRPAGHARPRRRRGPGVAAFLQAAALMRG